MAHRLRLVALVVATVTSMACRGQGASPDGRDLPHVTAAIEEAPPTLNDAASATYWGGQARQITLTNGEYRGPKGQHVQLLRQFYRTGDLEGDGAVDTVVVLSVTDAGEESGQYLAVLRHLESDTISLGAERIGDQIEVRDVRIEGKRIIVDLLHHSSPGAAPDPAHVTYELGRGELVKVEAAQTR
jgi:hypothetical protein